jgi:hypothetical protein
MSGRQYDLSFDAQVADILKRLHVLETAGPYDSQIAALGPVKPYNPVWGSTGTAPALGNGTLVGKYIQANKLVIAWVSMVLGSTSTYGTGTYTWTLPTVAHNANGVPEMQGTWIGAPTAGSVFGGITDVDTAFGASLGACRIQVSAAAATYGGMDLLTKAIPATWVSGGSMRMTFIYETS